MQLPGGSRILLCFVLFYYSRKSYFFCMIERVIDIDSDKEFEDSTRINLENVDYLNNNSKEIFNKLYKANFKFFDDSVSVTKNEMSND